MSAKGWPEGPNPPGKGLEVVEGVWISGVYARVERKRDEETKELDQWAQELGAGCRTGTGLRVVVGDFNAHHTDWGNRTDKRGKTIKSAVTGAPT